MVTAVRRAIKTAKLLTTNVEISRNYIFCPVDIWVYLWFTFHIVMDRHQARSEVQAGRGPGALCEMRQFVLLFPLHPPVLEPDFNLTFCQVQRMRDFNATTACEVTVEVKFFLQFQSLVAGVRSSGSLVFSAIVCRIQKNFYRRKK